MSLRHKGLLLVPALVGCWTLRSGDDRPDGARRDVTGVTDVTGADVMDVTASDVTASDVTDAPIIDASDVRTMDATDVGEVTRDGPDIRMDVRDVPDVPRDATDIGADVRDATDIGADVPVAPSDVPLDGADVPIVAPSTLRLVSPPGMSTVTSPLPTLRWSDDVSGMELVICASRECTGGPTHVVPVSGRSYTLVRGMTLSEGMHYWHLRRRDQVSAHTATWQFRVPVAVAGGDSTRAWGVSCRDTNRDGFADVAVGAPGRRGTAVPGAVHVHTGSIRGLSEAQVLTANGSTNLGADLAWGDFTGDLRADLVVVAQDATASLFGSLWYFQATPMGFLQVEALSCGAACSPGGTFARRVTAGDIDGDGIDDIFVSGSGSNAAVRAWPGRSFGPGGDPLASLRVTDGETTDFGASLAFVGDLDGDGFGDLVVGAPCDAPAGCAAAGRGRLHLYFGNRGWFMNRMNPIVIEGPGNGRLGLAVAPAGDVDEDGYADFVVGGTSGSSVAGSGAVFLLRGGPRSQLMSAFMPAALRLTPTGQTFVGASVAMVDMNGDGRLDLVAGAPGTEPAIDAARGAVLVWRQSTSMRFDDVATLLIPASGASIGARVTAVGDVNGDGRGELVATAPASVGTTTSNGMFFVWDSGNPNLPRNPDGVFMGASALWLGRGLSQ